MTATPAPTTTSLHGSYTALFVCVQNSGRSQMAAALLKARAGGRVGARSVGSAPLDELTGNPR